MTSSGPGPYESMRLESLKATLSGVVSRLETDESISAMRNNPHSSVHVSARVDEILERSLSHDREAVIRDLTDRLSASDLRCEHLSSENALLKKELLEAHKREASDRREHEEKLDRLSSKLYETSMQLREALERLSRGSDAGSAAASVTATASWAMEQHMAATESVRRHADKLAEELKESRVQISRVARERDVAVAEAKEHRSRTEILTAKLSQAVDLLEAQNAALSEAQKAQGVLEVRVAEVRHSLVKTREEVARTLRGTQDWMRTSFAAAARSVAERTQSSFRSASTECVDLRARLQGTADALKAAREEKERIASSGGSALAALQRERDSLRRDLEEASAECRELRSALTSAAESSRKAQETAAVREKELAKAKSEEAQRAVDQREGILRELGEVKQQLSLALAEVATLRSLADKTNRERDGLARKAAEFESSLMLERRDAQDRARDVSSLEDALRRLQGTSEERDAALRDKAKLDGMLREVLATVSGYVSLPQGPLAEASEENVREAMRQLSNALSKAEQSNSTADSRARQLAADNAALSARALKAENDVASMEQELKRAQRHIDELQRMQREREQQLSQHSLRESALESKLQRHQQVVQQMMGKDREIERLHRELDHTSEQLSLESLLQSSQVDPSKLTRGGSRGSKRL